MFNKKCNKIIAVLIALCLMITMITACSDDKKSTDSKATPGKASATANTTDKATEKPTNSSTEAPTKEPTPVPTENPHASYFDVDAVLTRFDEYDESHTTLSACDAYVNDDDPYLTVKSLDGDKHIIVPFGENEEYDVTEYPYIAVRYKVGIGNSVGQGNHFYAVTTTGGPTNDEGWWYHADLVADGDWHILVLETAKCFPKAVEGSSMKSLRFPLAAEEDGFFYIAYMGAFKSEADVTSFDTGYTLTYGDKLVKDKAPTEKEEVKPDTETSFTEVEADFEDGADGSNVTGSYIGPDWVFAMGANQSTFVNKDNNVICNLVFDAFSFAERVENGKAYTVKFDVQNAGNTKTNFAGFVMNYGNECNVSRNFYETNGIIGDGSGSIVSKSGIGVFFTEGGKVKIYVITYNADTNKIEHISHEFDTGINFASQFVKFKAHDDGKGKVSFYANDTLIASVTYADDGLLPTAATAYKERYYRSASILNGAGTQVAATNSALISYTKAFGFGARSHSIYIDNVAVENN